MIYQVVVFDPDGPRVIITTVEREAALKERYWQMQMTPYPVEILSRNEPMLNTGTEPTSEAAA